MLTSSLPANQRGFCELDGIVRRRVVRSKAEEIERIRRAAALSDRAMDALARELRPGLDERELLRIVEQTYLGEWGTNKIHFTTTTFMQTPSICVPAQFSAARRDVFITGVSACLRLPRADFAASCDRHVAHSVCIGRPAL